MLYFTLVSTLTKFLEIGLCYQRPCITLTYWAICGVGKEERFLLMRFVSQDKFIPVRYFTRDFSQGVKYFSSERKRGNI